MDYEFMQAFEAYTGINLQDTDGVSEADIQITENMSAMESDFEIAMEGLTTKGLQTYFSTLKGIKPHAKAFESAKKDGDWNSAAKEASICAEMLNNAATELSNADANLLTTSALNILITAVFVIVQFVVIEMINLKIHNKRIIDTIEKDNAELNKFYAERTEAIDDIDARTAQKNSIFVKERDRLLAERDALSAAGADQNKGKINQICHMLENLASQQDKVFNERDREYSATMQEFDRRENSMLERHDAKFNKIDDDMKTGDEINKVVALVVVLVRVTKDIVKKAKSGKGSLVTSADANMIVNTVLKTLRRKAKSYEAKANACALQSRAATECWLF